MPRRSTAEPRVPWKIQLPASTAGKVEHILFRTSSNAPAYGARAHLINALLQWWIARETGTPEDQLPRIPWREELLHG